MMSFATHKDQSEYFWSDTQIKNEIAVLNSQLEPNTKDKEIPETEMNGDFVSSAAIRRVVTSTFSFEKAYHRRQFLNLIIEAREIMQQTAFDMAKKTIDSLEQARIKAKDYAVFARSTGNSKQTDIFHELYQQLGKSESKSDIIKCISAALKEIEVKPHLRSYYDFPYFVSDDIRVKMESILNQLKDVPANQVVCN